MDFEKLNVWKTSARLSADLYKTLKTLDDYGFKDQITRSGLSVPSNIAEGMSRISQKEKIRFLDIARASCSEVRTQIFIGMDINYIDKKIGSEWLVKNQKIGAMLSALINKIKSTEVKT